MRMQQLLSWLAGSLLATLSMTSHGAAADCPFSKWQTYKGTQLYRTAQKTAYLYITARAAVDADGAPTAYHPDDVGKPCKATGTGLDCPGNAGYPTKSWWPTMLVPDPAHPSKAYVQPSGPTKGYFVSRTALIDKAADERDTLRYVDARNVPYLVFPGPFYALKGSGKLGDLGAAYHLTTHRWTPFIVADIGPNEPLGESSIALLKALGGDNPNPRNGQGLAAGQVMYIVFPGSVDDRAKPWPLTNEELAGSVKQRLDQVGGESVFEACVHP